MRTLCQHIFDLAQNSINAKSKNVTIKIEEDTKENIFKITVIDDGSGIKSKTMEKVKNTFYTTRPYDKRRVGLGLSLMDATCERTQGNLHIESKEGQGTIIIASMKHDNIDRPPLGDLADIFTSLFLSTVENKIIWTFEHIYNDKRYSLKNRMVKEKLNIIFFSDKGTKDKLYRFIKSKEKEIYS